MSKDETFDPEISPKVKIETSVIDNFSDSRRGRPLLPLIAGVGATPSAGWQQKAPRHNDATHETHEDS